MDDQKRYLLNPGQMFGQYKIISLIGSGGMGQVYRVRDTMLKEEFALKLLHPDISRDPASAERLETEAQTAFKLRHPNVLGIDVYSREGDIAYLRMTLIRGLPGREDRCVTLADLLTREKGRINECDAAIILHDMLLGLNEAHKSGIVHRDLKPANILFNGEVAVISDFGLVRVVGEKTLHSRLEESRTMMSIRSDPESTLKMSSGRIALEGTFKYMSPEQHQGVDVGVQSDVYSLGLIALEMLTGSTTVEMKPVTEIVRGLSPAWNDFVRKALARNVKERFQSAAQMLEAFPHIKGKAQILKSRKLPEPRRRSGKALPILAGMALLLGAGAAYVYVEDPYGWLKGLRPSGMDTGNAPAQTQPAPSIAQHPPAQPTLTTPAPDAPPSSAKQSPATPPPLQAQLPVPAPPASPPAEPTLAALTAPSQPQPAPGMAPVPPATAPLPSQNPSAEPLPSPLQTVAAATVETPAKLTPAAAEPEQDRSLLQITLPGGVLMELRLILPGSFRYGSPTDETGRSPTREETPRTVTISKEFYLGLTELTQAQYRAITNRNPSRSQDPDKPVEQISLGDLNSATGFFELLNRHLAQSGHADLHARLPSEEEWEYACRAGSVSAFNDGSCMDSLGIEAKLAKIAVFGRRTGRGAERVASLAPNAWGLYDMHGNVEEITSKGVLRGGSWASPARDCRSAARRNLGSSFRGDTATGMRVLIERRK